MVVDHGYTGRAAQGVSSRWVLSMAIQGGQIRECQGDGYDHCYTGRAEQGVSRRWVLTTDIQGGHSRECQGDGW